MQHIVFYSWQSDLPNSTNRGFIQGALEEAMEGLAAEGDPKIEPVLDRDTAGVAGSPDIGQTIFAKIDKSTALVCDVSIVNSNSQGDRPMPNPNVLIELGFGLKALGSGKIIMVMNTHYGGPEVLPFDLRQKRVIKYSLAETETNKASKRKALAGPLSAAIKEILLDAIEAESLEPDPSSLSAQAIEAIKAGRPDQGRHIGNFMKWLAAELKALDPVQQSGIADENLVQAIDRTIPLVQDFDRVADAVSAMNSADAARALHKGFESLLTLCYLPEGFSGGFKASDFDFFKFVANELFVTFVAYLMRDERRQILDNILAQQLHVKNLRPNPMRSFSELSEHVVLLNEVRRRRLNSRQISIHADILKERHDKGALSTGVSWEEFKDADLILFLKGFAGSNQDTGQYWWPQTAVYLGSHVPRYLTDSTTLPGAKQLAALLGVKGSELRTHVTEALTFLRDGLRQMGSYQFLFGGFDPNKIATPPA